MSSGYLTTLGGIYPNGTDLSNIFIPSGGGTFTGAITTSAGIIGPSTSITYTGMIGNTIKVPATSSIGTPSTATYTSLIVDGFTMPIGVFIVRCVCTNTYASSASSRILSFMNLGISSSNTGYDISTNAGFMMSATGSATIPTSASGSISGLTTNIYNNTSSTTKYYLLQLINTNATFTNNQITSTQTGCYVTYTRIA